VPGHINQLCGIALDLSSGNVWVADSFNNRIQEFLVLGPATLSLLALGVLALFRGRSTAS